MCMLEIMQGKGSFENNICDYIKMKLRLPPNTNTAIKFKRQLRLRKGKKKDPGGFTTKIVPEIDFTTVPTVPELTTTKQVAIDCGG